jgi:hypothetical protein
MSTPALNSRPSINPGVIPAPAGRGFYLDPAPTPTGTIASGGPTAAPTVDTALIAKLMADNKGINLDQAVTYEGKAYTIGQLIQSQKDLAATRAELAAAQPAISHIKTIYGKAEPKAEEARASLIASYQLAGWTEAEAVAEVNRTLGDPSAPPEPKQTSRQGGGGKSQETPDHVTNLVKQQISERIEQMVDAQLDGEEFKPILAGLARRDGDAAAVETRTELRNRLLADTRGALIKLANEKDTFDWSWIKEQAAALGKTHAGILRRYTGDPNKLGRTPANLSETDPFSVLADKPVERPSHVRDGQAHTPQYDKDFDNYAIDKLSRAAKEVLQGSF